MSVVGVPYQAAFLDGGGPMDFVESRELGPLSVPCQ